MAQRRKRRGGTSRKYRLWIYAGTGLIVVILGVLAALVVFRKDVVHEAIARELSRYGIENTSFSVAAVEQDHVILQSVRLAPDLRVERLRADFSLGGLMDGRVKTITVKGLDVKITDSRKGPLALLTGLAQGPQNKSAKGPPAAIPEILIENATLRAETGLGEGTIRAEGRISPKLEVSLDLQAEGTIRAVANHPVKLDGLEARLGTPEGGLPARIDVTKGTANDLARSPLFKELQIKGTVRAYRDRVRFQMSGEGGEGGEDAVGFAVNGRYALAGGSVDLDHVRIRAFDGVMSTKDVRFSPGEPVTIPVTFERVDMAELMKRTGLEGVSGTGRLSGTIPVELRGDKVIVHEGTLAAIEDGVLQFKSQTAQKALSSGGQDVTMLLSALEDFRYTKLSLTVKKDEAGEAVIRLCTEGRNPAVQDGRKFIINVNLSVNLDDILTAFWESYRLSGAAIRSTVRGAK